METRQQNQQVVRLGQLQNVSGILKEHEENLGHVLPKCLSVERFVRIAYNAVATNPNLLRCTKHSFVRAISQAAELGLEVSGTLGHAYLIPYGDTVTLVPGYKGFVALMKRVGYYVTQADVIYSDDEYEIIQGTEAKIRHKPNLMSQRDDSAIIAAYSIIETPVEQGADRTVVIKYQHYSTRPDIERARSCSKQPNGTTWMKFYKSMAIKTELRSHVKTLGLENPEIEKLLEVDNELFDLNNQKPVSQAVEFRQAWKGPPRPQTRLAEAMAAHASPPPPEAPVEASTAAPEVAEDDWPGSRVEEDIPPPPKPKARDKLIEDVMSVVAAIKAKDSTIQPYTRADLEEKNNEELESLLVTVKDFLRTLVK